MENQDVSVIRKSSKSNCSIKSMRILVVDDDATCLSIIAAILKSWKYEVVTAKHPSEALNTLKIKGSLFDLVITDVHMPDMSGFELQKKIDQEFKLPVVLMSADDGDSVITKGLQSGASFFIAKPVTPNDLKNLWQFAFTNKRRKATLKVDSSIVNDQYNDKKEYQWKARIENETKDAYATRKKSKFIWTSLRHNLFLDAIKNIGIDKAAPEKILENLNVLGLTRELVANHLQKYRLFVKRVSETNSRIQFDERQSATEADLPYKVLLRKYAVAGYFPLSESPKLRLSSSFNHKPSSSTNSILGSGADICGFLNDKSTSKQSMFKTSTSFNNANNFAHGNKPNFPFHGNVSKGIVIDREKSRMAGKGINNGLNIDISDFEKSENFNPQNINSESNSKGLDKWRNENKELKESRSVFVRNDQMNWMRNESGSIVSVLGSTCNNTLPKLGVSSWSDDKQPIIEPTVDQKMNNNYFGENIGIFGPLDNIPTLNTGKNCFLQKFGAPINASKTPRNQTNIHSQTQTGIVESSNFVFGNELMDGMENESVYAVRVPGGTCDDTLPKLRVSSLSDENQQILEQTPDQNNNLGENASVFKSLDDIFDSGNNCSVLKFIDQGNASYTLMNEENIHSQAQTVRDEIQQFGCEEVLPNFGIVGSSSSNQIFQPVDQISFEVDEVQFLRSLLIPAGKDD